jgi:hypothetical protein
MPCPVCGSKTAYYGPADFFRKYLFEYSCGRTVVTDGRDNVLKVTGIRKCKKVLRAKELEDK